MKVEELTPNKRNPRRISASVKAALRQSLAEYGDLSGIVWNETTKNLVGGHQRRDILKGATIEIITKYDHPTSTGTVAEGYVIKDGERYAYRAVRWDEAKEAEALIAANKIQGSWDADILKVMIKDIPTMNLKKTGFTELEFNSMGIDLQIPNDVMNQEGEVTAVRGDEELTDEEYVAQTEETTEQIPTESFSNVNESTKIENKRYVIIIDCPNQDVKESLKEKLQPELTQAGCKIF